MPVMAKQKPKPKTPTTNDAKPNRAGVPITVYIDPALRDSLNHYLAVTEPAPTITAIVSVALRRFLQNAGSYPVPDTD